MQEEKKDDIGWVHGKLPNLILMSTPVMEAAKVRYSVVKFCIKKKLHKYTVGKKLKPDKLDYSRH